MDNGSVSPPFLQDNEDDLLFIGYEMPRVLLAHTTPPVDSCIRRNVPNTPPVHSHRCVLELLAGEDRDEIAVSRRKAWRLNMVRGLITTPSPWHHGTVLLVGDI